MADLGCQFGPAMDRCSAQRTLALMRTRKTVPVLFVHIHTAWHRAMSRDQAEALTQEIHNAVDQALCELRLQCFLGCTSKRFEADSAYNRTRIIRCVL